MVTRLIGLLLGLALAAYGYGTLDPQGFAAPYLPAIDLGPFAGIKAQVAQFALGFGAVLSIAAVLPRFKGKTKKRPAVEFHDEPEAEEPRERPMMSSGAAQPSPLW